jgi:hypothetical protein
MRKRVLLAAFCILTLCSLLVMAAGTVKAYQEGYEVTDYQLITTPTLDGQWTTDEEWTDTDEEQLEGDLDAIFRLKFEGGGYPDAINQYFLIEIFNDTTDDAGDYWQMCYAYATTLQEDPTGGTTPQTDCLKFEFMGHDNASSGLTIYQGDGSGWVAGPAYTWPNDIEVVSSISASPLDSNPHWIFEIKIEHIHFAIQPNFWIYVAVHDDSNATAVQSWPTGSSDVPDDWGSMIASNDPIPEALTVGVVVLLLSVAVAVSFYFLRKRPKTESHNSGKMGEINCTS